MKPSPLFGEALEKCVDDIGVEDLALANVAMVPQYSEDDDISVLEPSAQAEILHYRELGKIFTREVLQIVHTHAASSKEERL